jgi:hypothetical protein
MNAYWNVLVHCRTRLIVVSMIILNTSLPSFSMYPLKAFTRPAIKTIVADPTACIFENSEVAMLGDRKMWSNERKAKKEMESEQYAEGREVSGKNEGKKSVNRQNK